MAQEIRDNATDEAALNELADELDAQNAHLAESTSGASSTPPSPAPATDAKPLDNWFQLWSSADASPNTGQWFALDVAADRNLLPSVPAEAKDTRSGITQRAALLRTDRDGVTWLTVELRGGLQAQFEAFGFTSAQLFRLASTISSASDGEPRFDHDAESLLTGMKRLVSRHSDQAGFDSNRLVADADQLRFSRRSRW